MLRHGRREAVRLLEVDAGARAPILRRYLAVAPGARAHLPVAAMHRLRRSSESQPMCPFSASRQ
ncbi:hypothetical protein BJF90_32370 [Pseudonocardia sp. CNS-004]|nr:hypothetical protein BJF90_32370 [Pseudonocardia sp. CNS-004]